jgi:hypothetical protein
MDVREWLMFQRFFVPYHLVPVIEEYLKFEEREYVMRKCTCIVNGEQFKTYIIQKCPLCTAAPQLLEALKGVIGWLDYTGMAGMTVEPSRLNMKTAEEWVREMRPHVYTIIPEYDPLAEQLTKVIEHVFVTWIRRIQDDARKAPNP